MNIFIGLLSLLLLFTTPCFAYEFSYLQSDSQTTNSNQFTFSSQNLGTADANRYIIVGVTGRWSGTSSYTLSSITVGGVSASLKTLLSYPNVNTNWLGIYMAAVPTGTTGDVVLTFSGVINNATIHLWRAVGLASTSAYNTNYDYVNPISATVSVPDYGAAVAIAAGGTSSSTASWTGMTEKYDTVIESEVNVTSASYETTSATSLAFTCTFSSAGTEVLGLAAAFRFTAPVPVAPSVYPGVMIFE